jgi:hypothetical protein
MGVMSTLGVSRNVALAALAHVEYGHLSDEEIEQRLDLHVQDKLYDVSIRSETRDGDATTLGYAIGADFDHLR